MDALLADRFNCDCDAVAVELPASRRSHLDLYRHCVTEDRCDRHARLDGIDSSVARYRAHGLNLCISTTHCDRECSRRGVDRLAETGTPDQDFVTGLCRLTVDPGRSLHRHIVRTAQEDQSLITA